MRVFHILYVGLVFNESKIRSGWWLFWPKLYLLLPVNLFTIFVGYYQKIESGLLLYYFFKFSVVLPQPVKDKTVTLLTKSGDVKNKYNRPIEDTQVLDYK
jgi:hypothetical protein